MRAFTPILKCTMLKVDPAACPLGRERHLDFRQEALVRRKVEVKPRLPALFVTDEGRGYRATSQTSPSHNIR